MERAQRMKTEAMKTGVMIIVNACIWGLVILSCSHALKGTGAYEEIQNILVGGAGSTMLLILFGTRMPFMKQNGESADQDVK